MDDVPGSLAPAIYFQYLADGQPEPLLGVFQHNETDMLSLACLAIRFGHLLNGDLSIFDAQPAEHEELLRTGLWLEKMGRIDHAEQLFARLAEEESMSSNACVCWARETRNVEIGRVLCYCGRRLYMLSNIRIGRIGKAHIELAMYYEHKTKQLEAALTLAETSLSLAQRRYSGLRLDAKRRSELEAIRKRMDRLRSKIKRHYG